MTPAPMDCNTFQNSEIDALYGELDAAAQAAMDAHAATCASCAARYARLCGTRSLVLSVAVDSVSENFESRVMAAVDAGLASKRAGSGAGAGAAMMAAAPTKAAPAEGGAKIFQFMARPAFAVAATFVLVIGAAAVLMQTSMGRKMSPTATSADQAPAAVAASMAAATAAAPGEGQDLAGYAAAPAATTTAMAPGAAEVAAVTSPAASGALALNEPHAAPVVGASRGFSPPPPAARPAAMAPSPSPSPTAKPAKAGKPASDELVVAKNLAAAGKCSEAMPKLEALKGSNPEAELYAARCIAKTGNCARFDTAAERNAGTDTGNRATIEGARCYQATGNVVAARKRLEAAKSEGNSEASHALDALDNTKATGGPAGAGHATPKAASPAPATESLH